MRQLICRRTCEWLEIGYTYRAVRISYLVHLAEVAHIHTGYCKITTCYRARPDKRAQRVAFSSNNASECVCVCVPTDFGRHGDPTDSLARYQASLEARCYDNVEEARLLWSAVMSRHGRESHYWLEYAGMERSVCTLWTHL